MNPCMDTQALGTEIELKGLTFLFTSYYSLLLFLLNVHTDSRVKIHVKHHDFRKRGKASLAMGNWLGMNSLLLSSP